MLFHFWSHLINVLTWICLLTSWIERIPIFDVIRMVVVYVDLVFDVNQHENPYLYQHQHGSTTITNKNGNYWEVIRYSDVLLLLTISINNSRKICCHVEISFLFFFFFIVRSFARNRRDLLVLRPIYEIFMSRTDKFSIWE